MKLRTRTLKQLMSLEERVALVTGGAGHIGAILCEALAELGASIAVLDVAEAACAELADQIHRTYHVKTLPLAMDLSNQDGVRAVPELVLEHFGQLDILINCAALVGTSDLQGWVVPFQQQSAETFRLALETNLLAPFVLTQGAAKALSASGRGSVVNISSVYGMVGPDPCLYEGTPLGNPAAYAASKGGLLQITRWLSTVMAPSVRVNAVTCGGVWRNQPKAFATRYAARTPLKRMAVEEDFQGAVAYLASDLSAYVTGQNLVVDGGWTTW